MKSWLYEHWEEIVCAAILVALFFLVISTAGCCSAKCVKIVKEPVEVLVPVPVEAPALPLPEDLECPWTEGDWRTNALFVKECFDSALLKIEQYRHVIVSHNETRRVP
jgi:hypothetical protein